MKDTFKNYYMKILIWVDANLKVSTFLLAIYSIILKSI